MTVEGGETATATEGSSNGASSHAAALSAARAAFMGGESSDADEAKPAIADEAADDDSDLDEAPGEDADDADEEEVADDADADLDEDEEKSEDEEDEKDVDADTAKRLSQVRKTDKRLREQRDRDFKAREAEIDAKAREYESRFHAEIEQWKPRVAAAERFEKLASRASVDPVAVLQALGVKDDAFAYIGQALYTHAKAKDDPKAQAAYAQMAKARELDAEVENLKKWREEREKTDKEREQQTAADREVEAFIGSVAKAVSDKMALSRALMKNDPDAARDEMQVVAFKLAKESGKLPDAKAVAIAFEKAQRAKLRKLGIDPKSRGAAAAVVAAANDSKTKTTPKKGEKIAKPSTKADEEKPMTREDFIRLPGGKFD